MELEKLEKEVDLLLHEWQERCPDVRILTIDTDVLKLKIIEWYVGKTNFNLKEQKDEIIKYIKNSQ